MSPLLHFPPIGDGELTADCTMETLEEWFESAETGDVAAIRRFLSEGVDVNAFCVDQGLSALQIAVLGAHEVTVEVLLQAGADDELTTLQEPRTALELAGYYGYTHCMWLLFRSRVARGLKGASRLRLGAELMLKSCEMVYAARQGDYDCVREMLDDNAAYAHAMDKKTGETAFSAALAQGRKKMCELLLKYGAYAVGVCVTPYVGLINRYKHDSPVRHVTKKWDLPLLQWLLSKGANPHVRAVDDTCSALAWAVYHGRTPFVDLLLSSGAELDDWQCTWITLPETMGFNWSVWNARETKEETPMSWLLLALACWGRHLSLVRYLFETCEDLRDERHMEEQGAIPLYMAVHQEDEELVKELLKEGAPVNGEVLFGSVPLEAAVRVDSVSMMRLLNDNGADIHHYISAGGEGSLVSRLIRDATRFGAVSCAEELLRLDPTGVSELSISNAVNKGDVGILSVLFRYHAKLLPARSAGKLIQKAAEDGDYEMLELLLNRSAPLSSETMQRALIAACLRGRYDAARVLLSRGVEINRDTCAPGSREPVLHLLIAQADKSDAMVDTLLLVLESASDSVTLSDPRGFESLRLARQWLQLAETRAARARLMRVQRVLLKYGAMAYAKS